MGEKTHFNFVTYFMPYYSWQEVVKVISLVKLNRNTSNSARNILSGTSQWIYITFLSHLFDWCPKHFASSYSQPGKTHPYPYILFTNVSVCPPVFHGFSYSNCWTCGPDFSSSVLLFYCTWLCLQKALLGIKVSLSLLSPNKESRAL